MTNKQEKSPTADQPATESDEKAVINDDLYERYIRFIYTNGNVPGIVSIPVDYLNGGKSFTEMTEQGAHAIKLMGTERIGEGGGGAQEFLYGVYCNAVYIERAEVLRNVDLRTIMIGHLEDVRVNPYSISRWRPKAIVTFSRFVMLPEPIVQFGPGEEGGRLPDYGAHLRNCKVDVTSSARFHGLPEAFERLPIVFDGVNITIHEKRIVVSSIPERSK